MDLVLGLSILKDWRHKVKQRRKEEGVEELATTFTYVMIYVRFKI